jgi:hypothetical protein
MASPTTSDRPVDPLLAVGVALAALVFAVLALWAGFAPAPAMMSAAVVRLEPISDPGPTPFMTPVGRDRAGLAPPPGAGGTYPGDTEGLFGESGERPSCDGLALTAALGAEPVKARAWADALVIGVEDISSLVAGLHPVLLRSDTAVTSHGYTDGHEVPYPAVLQAGTAVFVDSHGVPTVKCFNGNPLTESRVDGRAGHAGPGWELFTPSEVTTIRPTRAVLSRLTAVDVDRGRARQHPAPRSSANNPRPGS